MLQYKFDLLGTEQVVLLVLAKFLNKVTDRFAGKICALIKEFAKAISYHSSVLQFAMESSM